MTAAETYRLSPNFRHNVAALQTSKMAIKDIASPPRRGREAPLPLTSLNKAASIFAECLVGTRAASSSISTLTRCHADRVCELSTLLN
jgi:hypothetical protein